MNKSSTLNLNDGVPIVFVWIGPRIPKWAAHSLKFCSEKNPETVIYLVTNAVAVDISFSQKHFRKIHIPESTLSAYKNQLPTLRSRSDFWLNTSLRFFALRWAMDQLDLHRVFHAELDNAVFCLDGLAQRFDSHGEGVFAPRDSLGRAIASLMYCNNTEALDKFLASYGSNPGPKNDMDALGKFAQKYPGLFYSLPTESFEEYRKSWKLLSPEQTGGIFDAAAIGQWLLGVDPIHSRWRPCRNGFVNENSRIDFNNIELIVNSGKFYIKFKKENRVFLIYNLHLHSKNWQAFSRVFDQPALLMRLNSGKKTVLSNHLSWAIYPIYMFLRFLRSSFRLLTTASKCFR